MCIGLITDEVNHKDTARRTAQFADDLLAAGHEVNVVTVRAPGGRPGLLQMHVLPDPRGLNGRALAVEAAALRAPALLRRDGRRPRLAVMGGVADPPWSEPLHRMGLADPLTIHGHVAEAEAVSSVGRRGMLAMSHVTPWARNLRDAPDGWRVRIEFGSKEN